MPRLREKKRRTRSSITVQATYCVTASAQKEALRRSADKAADTRGVSYMGRAATSLD